VAVEVGGQPGGGQRPVAGDQVSEDGGVQGGLAGCAGGPGGVAGLDQQARHLGCPLLLRWLEVMQALEIPERVNPAPGVQGAGQVAIAGVAVADDHALIAGQHTAGIDCPR
jgi:hypothetical protein